MVHMPIIYDSAGTTETLSHIAVRTHVFHYPNFIPRSPVRFKLGLADWRTFATPLIAAG